MWLIPLLLFPYPGMPGAMPGAMPLAALQGIPGALREATIAAVVQTGGDWGASLGVPELTAALG